MCEDAVHRQHPLGYALVVHNGQARRTWLLAMVCKALWISSSGLQVKTFFVAISPTLSSPANSFLVPMAMQISRSVTTPTSVLSGPMTGNIPQLRTHMSSTAAPTFVFALQQTTDCVMMSFAFMVVLLALLRALILS